MTAPIDTVSWCALERTHQPLTASTPVLRPNWKAGCLETNLSGLDRGKGHKILPIGIPNLMEKMIQTRIIRRVSKLDNIQDKEARQARASASGIRLTNDVGSDG